MPVNTVSIVLDRQTKVFRQGEHITGVVIIENKYDLKHDGIFLSLEGSVDIHFNLKSISFMETFYGSNKTIQLVNIDQELSKKGELQPGLIELPFQVVFDKSCEQKTFYETYYGVFISIQYFIKCYIKRPFFAKDLTSSTEFYVEYDLNPIGAPTLTKKPIKFKLTPECLGGPQDIVPEFCVSGQLDSSVWRLTEPITGLLIIEKCLAIIRSVELQLVRIETCGVTPGDRLYSRDSTEVQNIQIGEGNLCRNVPIPIYMVLPRLFTCPTIATSDFKIEFEINLVIIFDDNHLITENFPIKLMRSTLQPINWP